MAAYIPTGLQSRAQFYVPDRMRAATGATLPSAGARPYEWEAYFRTVSGANLGAPDAGVGYGVGAEGYWSFEHDPRLLDLDRSRFIFGVHEVEAEIDLLPSLGLLAATPTQNWLRNRFTVRATRSASLKRTRTVAAC